MRTAALALVAGGVAVLASLPPTQAHAAPVLVPPVLVPQASLPAIQPVWYDRWGRWHPPHYYAHPYGYWRWRRAQCFRWGNC